MSVTIGISVRNNEEKNELSAKLKKIPGETDQERLEYCLNSVLSTQNVTGNHKELLQAVRDVHEHMLDIILGELEQVDIRYEQNISNKQKSIDALAHQVEDLQAINLELNKKISELTDENMKLHNQVLELCAKLSDSDDLRRVLQTQLAQEKNNPVDKATDLVAQLKEIISDIRKAPPEQQITMFDIAK